MKLGKPARKEIVPTGDHRQPRTSSYGQSAGAKLPKDEQQNDDGSYDARPFEAPERDRQNLWNGPDKVHLFRRNISQYGAGAQDKHQSNDRRRNEHRSSNAARRAFAFTRQDRHILKPTERSERNLAKNVQTEKRKRGHGHGERMILAQGAHLQAKQCNQN